MKNITKISIELKIFTTVFKNVQLKSLDVHKKEYLKHFKFYVKIYDLNSFKLVNF